MATDTEYVSPYTAQRDAAQAALLALAQQQLTPEQQAQLMARQYENDKQAKLGMLMQVGPNEGMQQLGSAMYKGAIAERAPHVTERGAYDPLTRQFTENPEFQRDRLRAEVARVDEKDAAARAQWAAGRQATRERIDEAERMRQFHTTENAANRAARGSNEPLVQAIDPNTGQAVFVPRSQAAGMAPVPAAGGQPNEGERNAAGYAARMAGASHLLDTFEGGGKPTTVTQAAGAVPWVGDFLQRSAQTAGQQQYSQAAQDWVRAKLRKESGAAIGKDEMAQEIRAYFPQPGDGPEVIAQKRQARGVATQAMVMAAGRAAIPGADDATTAPRATNFPRTLGRGQQGGGTPTGAPARLPQSAPADPLGLRQ